MQQLCEGAMHIVLGGQCQGSQHTLSARVRIAKWRVPASLATLFSHCDELSRHEENVFCLSLVIDICGERVSHGR